MDVEDAVNESDAPMREAEPGPVHMEPDDDVYKAQAADVFMDDSNDDEDLVRMVESLNQLGVDDLLDAQAYVDGISSVPRTFVKVYGRGGICDDAGRLRKLNSTSLAVMDLCTNKPNGSPWDFSKRNDRELARSMIAEEDPDFVIGAPPCTDFS